MTTPVKRVVIAGGGTAGWIAAAALSKHLGQLLDITLVGSRYLSDDDAKQQDEELAHVLNGLKASVSQTVAKLPRHLHFINSYCRATT